MERVSIVIPIRDEEDTIGLVLEDLRKATSDVSGYEFETIIVDDGSSDRGPEIARTYGAHVISNAAPHGKGTALRTGFAASTGRLIVMMDGDYSHRAEDLGVLLDALRPGVSLVVGSRIFGGSEEYTPVRAFGNIVLTYVFGLLHGRYLSDALNGYKAFRRDVFTGFTYTSVGFEIEIELIANALRTGGRIVEVPSHERARAGGKSKSRIVRHGTRFLTRVIYEWARSRRR
jgi:glycosyltransferase involved in cell wall biosynthesis